ncbi:MAG: ImuA family protein [Phycisphaerales bacterium]
MRGGDVHEWFTPVRDQEGRAARVHAPLGVFMLVASEALAASEARPSCVWIGRGVWPNPAAMARVSPRLLRGSIFVDPCGHDERVWAIDLALRARGVAVVIGDASRLTMSESRRLQLAAEAGGTLGLLARAWTEAHELSAARTRWLVVPSAESGSTFDADQRWTVELLRCKGVRPTSPRIMSGDGGVRRWAARRSHATGHVHLVPLSRDRSAPAEAPGRRLGA